MDMQTAFPHPRCPRPVLLAPHRCFSLVKRAESAEISFKGLFRHFTDDWRFSRPTCGAALLHRGAAALLCVMRGESVTL